MILITFSEGVEVFCFSVIESSFCFDNEKFITVSAISFIADFELLRAVQKIFVWKVRFDAACVLEYVPS